MAESLAFFDRPKEPRVGFELPVPRCARPADSAVLAVSPDSVVSSSSWNGPLHSIGCQGRQPLGCYRRAYGRSAPSRTKPENCCLSGDCGRDAHYWAPPAQNRTCSFPVYGSHLGCLTAGLGLPYAPRRRGHAFPALCPARAASVRVLLGLRPWLHRLRCRSPGLVRRLRCYYGGV